MADESVESNVLEDFFRFLHSNASLVSLLHASNNKQSNQDDKEQQESSVNIQNTEQRIVLLETCQHLFQRVERLSKELRRLDGDKTATTSLSGLDELYLGSENSDEDPIDAETIWGQVDLQNEALKSLLKKAVKRLGKAADSNDANEVIQLLDIESAVLEEREGSSEPDENEQSESDNDGEIEEGEEDDDEEQGGEEQRHDDEVTRRINERMERAMDDDDGSEEAEDEDENTAGLFGRNSKSKRTADEKGEDLNIGDPAANELNNGFFDINEMEAFADEEEDLLPVDALKPSSASAAKTVKPFGKTKSFHQRQRDGDFDDNDDDDDDDEELQDDEEVTERKKFRPDDEIDALYSMYKEAGEMDDYDYDDDDEHDEAINMTAADLFGAPDKKYFHKWKANQKLDPSTIGNDNGNGKSNNDADSWDEYKLDDDEADWGKESKANLVSISRAGSDSGNSDVDEGSKVAKRESKPAPTSRHARDTLKLNEETERLEKEMLAEKPWQMTGEATATARPVNSLLEGTPEFQAASKMAPIITVEHTADLEEVIKRRILNEDWDDIIPRELPDVSWHKQRGELPEVSQEKSKLGLGELYEREFLKKAVGYDVDAAEKETEEEKAKNEMKQLFANICSKLDALSNYHFAPRPIADEADVKPATTPAIAMEEVLPLYVSDARASAPEEVFGKKRGRDGVLRSENELEQIERKRLRNSKKAARRKARTAKAADEKLLSRANPGIGLDTPFEKRKMREELSMARAEGKITTGKADVDGGYSSSGKFFKKMQDEVDQTIRDGRENEEAGQKKRQRSSKASAFKL